MLRARLRQCGIALVRYRYCRLKPASAESHALSPVSFSYSSSCKLYFGQTNTSSLYSPKTNRNREAISPTVQ
jgi:hypothetical protein